MDHRPMNWPSAEEWLAKAEMISMDFGDLERTVLSQWKVQGNKLSLAMLDDLEKDVLIQRRRSALMDAEACQADYIDDRVEAWGDSPWEKRIPRDRSGNRTPRLQAKIKNRQKAKQAKAARKHNR